MWETLQSERLYLYLQSAKNLHILLVAELFHAIKKTDSAFPKSSVGYLLSFIRNISAMLPQGLKQAWLAEAYLKSENPNNVSLVSYTEHGLK